MDSAEQKARAAYVHVPFCRHRCGYCSFTLVANRDDLIERYLRALETELSWLNEPQPVTSLFVGGGTPTHLRPRQLGALADLLNRWFPPATQREFTFEANPGDVCDDRMRVLADAGVNRLSIGAQSFDENNLRILERDHNAEDISRSVERAAKYLGNISLDLIFAVPGESLDVWQRDLSSALALRPTHLSTYGLTFEQGTSFWSRRRRGQLHAADEDLEAEMYVAAIDRLTDDGYEHYEVSSFAKPEGRCRHNQVYWSGAEFLAAGPGAARFVGGRREVNHRSTTTYLKRVLAGQSPVAEVETLPKLARVRERLVFGLRRLEGVDVADLAEEFDIPRQQVGGEAVDRFVALKLLRWEGKRLSLTRRGLLISDSLWPDILTER